jgi:hypothetical protein
MSQAAPSTPTDIDLRKLVLTSEARMSLCPLVDAVSWHASQSELARSARVGLLGHRLPAGWAAVIDYPA